MYPERVERLKTIASAPSLIVLVLNPLPSRTKQQVPLLRNNLPFKKTNHIHLIFLKGNTSSNKIKVMSYGNDTTKIMYPLIVPWYLVHFFHFRLIYLVYKNVTFA